MFPAAEFRMGFKHQAEERRLTGEYSFIYSAAGTRLVAAQLVTLAFVFLLCGTTARALDSRIHVSQYGHSVWRVGDGVLSATPMAIAQSRDGYIWIGTETGLLRFDGVSFTEWSSPFSNDLSGREIYTLMAASDGTLWIATDTQLAFWRNGKLTMVAAPGGIGRINEMLEDKEHRIWFAASRRTDKKPLCQVKNTAVRCFGPADGLDLRWGLDVIEKSDGSLLVASSDTVVNWSPERGKISSKTLSPISPFVSVRGIAALVTLKDGSTLVGMEYSGKGLGLQRFTEGRLASYTLPGFEGSSIAIETLYTDRSGTLWIGTVSNGLYRVAGSEVDHYTTREGLSGNAVRGFLEDREGNMWVVTDGGIDCFHDPKVVQWGEAEGLPSGFVRSISAGQDGTVLVGVGHTLAILKDGRVRAISGIPGMPTGSVDAVLEDRSGRHWASIGNELVIYNGKKFIPVKGPDGKSAGIVTDLAQSPDGSIWGLLLGPPHALIRIRDGKVAEIVRGSMGVSISADRDSGVWVHLFEKLGHYASGHFEWFDLPPHERTDSISIADQDDIATAADGSVFASSRTGVWILRNGNVRLLGIRNGLPCDGVNGLAFSKDQSLWMRTSCGLLKITGDSLEKWWKSPDTKVEYRLIGTSSGVHVSRAIFFPQMSLAPDGHIWIANESSVEEIDPDRIPINSVVPPVHIEEVDADHKKLRPRPGLVLPPLIRDLEIHYTGLSFSMPQKVQFRYKLEGHDTTWQEVGTRRTAFYQNLKPGHYRFRVIASNNDGLWNEAGDSFMFSVKPAWFQTLWFRALGFIAICLLLWVIYRIRIGHVAKELRAQEALRALKERLERATQVARAAAMSASIAHEINQPLGAIVTNAHAASTWLDASPANISRAKISIERVLRDGRVASDIAHKMRSLFARQAPEKQPVDVSHTAREILTLLEPEIRRQGAEIITNIPDGLDSLSGDPVQIQQILINLITNAMDAVQENPPGERRIWVEAILEGAAVAVRVRDTGRGVPNADRIFETFFTTKAKGMGIGLAVSRSIAEAHGGSLSVVNQPGAGAEFILRIPSVHGPETKDDHASRSQHETAAGVSEAGEWKPGNDIADQECL
jgi:signal transduction histidine kinase/ligand-binding sensor domain-containing protein